MLHSALNELVSTALVENHQVAILGDFKTATPRGRWGYSQWSATGKEDLVMNEWVKTSGLTKVLQHSKPIPTWRLNEGTKKAMLDRVFVTPDASPIPESLHSGIVQI